MRDLFNKLGNIFTKPLLRSPLHFFISGSLMLVTFTGRKSGKVYSTPVQYQQTGDTLTFFTQSARAWWKNLQGERPVTIRLKGRDVTAVASEFVQDDAAVANALRQMYPRMSAEKAAEIAPVTVMIRLRPT